MYHIRTTNPDGEFRDWNTDTDPAVLRETFTEAGFEFITELLGSYLMRHPNGTVVTLSVA